MRQFLPRRIISICRLSEEGIPPVSIPIAAVTKMMRVESSMLRIQNARMTRMTRMTVVTW
jgi:hypothetical protein